MELTNRFKVDENAVSYRVIAGEAVILNLEHGFYYSLNESGTRIWEQICENKTFEEITKGMSEEYDAKESVLQKEVMSVVQDLLDEKLIVKH